MSEQLSDNTAFELGLDVTGRDGNPNFPYTRENVVGAMIWKVNNPQGMMTRSVIERYVVGVKQALAEHDGEAAASMRDELYVRLLKAIASGAFDTPGETNLCVRDALILESFDYSSMR